MNKLNFLLTCGGILFFAARTQALQEVRYKYFDEYLLNLDHRQQYLLIEEVKYTKSSSLIRTGIHFSKEETCCSLGQLAGEKGYHCVAKFYARRVLGRNYNRAQGRRVAALHRGGPDPAADKLMRTFGTCVANRASIFHKCCRHAALGFFD